MHVLLLGSTGMAGCAIKKFLHSSGHSITGVARKNSDFDLDISHSNSLHKFLSNHDFDAIINAAAIVDIEYCDNEPYKSWKVNAAPLTTLANWSQRNSIPLLHISTDHYYPYGKNKPHTEADPIFFMNQYSVQKYAAEAYALTSSNALVVRTSILGQRKLNGLSLVDWAIKALKNNEKIKLFHDAWTSSIDVGTFANLACKIFFEHQQRGLINLAAREVYSKEMLIRELASRLDLSLENCVSLSINDYFTNRPNCLGLDVSKAELLLGYELPSMNDVLDSLLLDYKY